MGAIPSTDVNNCVPEKSHRYTNNTHDKGKVWQHWLSWTLETNKT